MEDNKEDKNRTNVRIRLAVCALVILVCAGILGTYDYKQRQAKQEYDKIKEVSGKDKAEEGEPEAKDVPEEKAQPENPIDFDGLWEQNEDIYAWLEIPGTVIDYPVLQHETDDAYYLNHTLEGEEGFPGAIYSERCCSKDFSGFFHILYGHNMKNGTMFGELHKYEAEDFFSENSKILVYTPKQIRTYQVFAAVVMSDDHLMYRYDFTTADGRQEYLEALRSKEDERNHYREEADVTAEDQLLVLSTCVNGEEDKRYVVSAVLVE